MSLDGEARACEVDPVVMADSAEYRLGSQFALRTPLLSARLLVGWSEGLAAPSAIDRNDLEAALAADRKMLRERLMGLAKRPDLREAIFVASPDCEQAFGTWFSSPESEKGQKVERSVFKYFARAASRSTPFGLLAGCSVGSFSDRSRLELTDARTSRRVTRLDMDYLYALAEGLKKTPLRHEIVYTTNSSAYLIAGRWRYAEGRLEENERSYHLVAVDDTDDLARALVEASSGARPTSLAQLLTDGDSEVSVEDATAFVDELIDTQLLVPTLMPAVTGPDPLCTLTAGLRACSAGGEIAETLERVQGVLARIDAAPVGSAPEAYRAVAEELQPLPAEVNIRRLFQVDFARGTSQASLGPGVGAALLEGVELLRRVGMGADRRSLEAFTKAFQDRYESQEVPLVEALDEDFGVGFESSASRDETPLLDGIAFGAPESEGRGFEARDAALLRALLKATRSGASEISLGEDEIVAMEPREPIRLPDAFALKAQILGSVPDLETGKFSVLLDGLSGPSGARWLGRFCHLDPRVHQAVEAHLKEEEASSPDAIYAEVVHLPRGRLGNILMRPVLREYEIPFLCTSAAAPNHRIHIEDLMVSVRDRRITLRSRRLDREVVPRMTNMHAYQHATNLPLYRFLTLLQAQACTGALAFSWRVLDGMPFLPRVVAGRFILSRAIWNIRAPELKVFLGADGAERYRALQRLRVERGLPRWIAVADGDNVLPFDLDNVLAVDTLAHSIRGRATVRVQELALAPNDLCVEGPDGPYAHELIALLTRNRPSPSATQARRETRHEANVPDPKRVFLPGSEWLYAKLYTGTSMGDQVLRELVAPVIDEAGAAGAIDRWFFLRYRDPDAHIRVRFHGDPRLLASIVAPALERGVMRLHASKLVSRFEIATYVRELERYGGPAIELSEQLFHADSTAVLEILREARLIDPTLRWRVALLGVHRLLCDFGLDVSSRSALLESWCKGGRAFHRVGADHETTVGARFRKERSSIEELLWSPIESEHSLASFAARLEGRSRALSATVAELGSSERSGSLQTPLPRMIQSFAHMHVNRLVPARAPLQELVIYELLARAHASRLARERRRPPTS
jgi:thiopeptide-type bacteriocin biosynthesis protein